MELKDSLKAMAILDIIMEPKEDSWLRLVTCHPNEDGCQFLIDNGSGDHLTIIFHKYGTIVKGFSHEDKLNPFASEKWDHSFVNYVYAQIPEELLSLLGKEDHREEVTFCLWHRNQTKEWLENETQGNDGGKEYLLGYICQTAEQWCEWAAGYYEITPDLEAVQAVYQKQPVTHLIIKALNPDRVPVEAMKEIDSLSLI